MRLRDVQLARQAEQLVRTAGTVNGVADLQARGTADALTRVLLAVEMTMGSECTAATNIAVAGVVLAQEERIRALLERAREVAGG